MSTPFPFTVPSSKVAATPSTVTSSLLVVIVEPSAVTVVFVPSPFAAEAAEPDPLAAWFCGVYVSLLPERSDDSFVLPLAEGAAKLTTALETERAKTSASAKIFFFIYEYLLILWKAANLLMCT